MKKENIYTDADTITLLAIELTTELKFGSKQSRYYLEEAKELFEKRKLK